MIDGYLSDLCIVDFTRQVPSLLLVFKTFKNNDKCSSNEIEWGKKMTKERIKCRKSAIIFFLIDHQYYIYIGWRQLWMVNFFSSII